MSTWLPAQPLLSSLPPIHFRSLLSLNDSFIVFVEAAHPGDPPLLRCIRVGADGVCSSSTFSLAWFPSFSLPWCHSTAFPPHNDSLLFLLSSSARLLLVVDPSTGSLARALSLAPTPLLPPPPGFGLLHQQLFANFVPGLWQRAAAIQTVCLAVSASSVPHFAHVFRFQSGYAVIFCRIETETIDSQGDALVLALFPALYHCGQSPLLLRSLSSSVCRIAITVAGLVDVFNLERGGVERVELKGVAQQETLCNCGRSHANFAWFAAHHDASCGGAVAFASADELSGGFVEKGPFDREQRIVSLPPGVTCRDVSLHGGRCLAFFKGETLFVMKRYVVPLEHIAREACIRAAKPRARFMLKGARDANHIPFRDTVIRVLGYGGRRV